MQQENERKRAEEAGLATLPIREDPNGAVSLTGLKHRAVASVGEAMDVLSDGARNRATGATSTSMASGIVVRVCRARRRTALRA